MSILELPVRAETLSAQVDYETQRHDCDTADFSPVECPPCLGCDHGECRHEGQPFPRPIDTSGMSEAQIIAVRKAEVYAVQAAMTASPCDVAGCPCSRFRCGDECEGCGGDGTVEDDRTGRTTDCRACYGRGVVA